MAKKKKSKKPIEEKTANELADREFVELAKQRWHRDGEIEIDDGAVVSRGDEDGAYVAAWVWVSAKKKEPNENRVR